METWKPTVGGILCIVVGIFGMVFGVLTLNSGPLTFVCGLIAIIGGLCALMRKAWWFALVGAIFALFPLQSVVLGILAIVFISLSKDEFDNA